MIVYPRNENDVRKTMRFAWQLAERGRSIPVTARGAGTIKVVVPSAVVSCWFFRPT